jgi:DNA-binding MarR family transcriptional regulator
MNSRILTASFGARKMANARIFVERKNRKRAYERDRFMMISQNGLAELQERLADRSLGMQAVRVLVAMLESVDYENRVWASQKDIALHLKMSSQEVSKASRALTDCGFVERIANRRGWYQISDRLAWKGSVERLHERRSARKAA